MALESKTSLLDSLKWWFGWPWFKHERETFDVGISVGTGVLDDETTFTVTRKGGVICSDWISHSKSKVYDAFDCTWVHADDDIFYASRLVRFFDIKTTSYLVYEDNTPVQA